MGQLKRLSPTHSRELYDEMDSIITAQEDSQ